jgi:hypothetical protein|tara:strand:- start:2712 stop:3026 length:315 start_codon:yes stop_codon:yes gene_type:complete
VVVISRDLCFSRTTIPIKTRSKQISKQRRGKMHFFGSNRFKPPRNFAKINDDKQRRRRRRKENALSLILLLLLSLWPHLLLIKKLFFVFFFMLLFVRDFVRVFG